MISHICVCEYTEGLVCVCVCVDVCPDRTHCLMHLASPKPIMKRMQNHATNKYCLTYTCMPHMSYMYVLYSYMYALYIYYVHALLCFIIFCGNLKVFKM